MKNYEFWRGVKMFQTLENELDERVNNLKNILQDEPSCAFRRKVNEQLRIIAIIGNAMLRIIEVIYNHAAENEQRRIINDFFSLIDNEERYRRNRSEYYALRQYYGYKMDYGTF